MRITKIAVKGLFGMFDHEIPLNQESRITIVHGPNGVGKTVLMEMVHGLFHFDYKFIAETPFQRFGISFDNGASIFVSHLFDVRALDVGKIQGSGYPTPSRLLIEYFDAVEARQVNIPQQFVPRSYNDFGYIMKALFEEKIMSTYRPIFLNPGDDKWWLNFETYELHSLADICETYPQIHNKIHGEMPDWFREMRQQASTELIQTQRLQRYEIRDLEGQSLEELEASPSTSLPVVVLGPSLILSSNRFTDGFSEEHFSDRFVVEEMQLFEELVNERLLFKAVSIDEYEGISVVSQDGMSVALNALSSGEQHLLMLYFQLLFEIGPDTLVMIDEPELSMNVVWQRNFLKDLQRISELRKFDVLVATHSPMIIHDKWDWVVHLGEKVDD